MRRLGLIVNPLAGIGGRVGLKGSDGAETVERALALGAVPRASDRARRAIEAFLPLPPDIEILTCGGSMGEDLLASCGAECRVVHSPLPGRSTAADTRRAAAAVRELGVDLLLFAGGDGTARDICASTGENLPVLGIPAGVKIQSAVFAASPVEAGGAARRVLFGEELRFRLAEVMDIDEGAYRMGELQSRLYGYLRVPDDRKRMQGLKSGTPRSEEAVQAAIAADIAERIDPERLCFVGPGTTTRAILGALGLEGTLLGVDALLGGRLVGTDLGEAEILRLLDGASSVGAIVTPIGGQGFLFGRGNQQFSPAVLRRIGRENLIVAATPTKLHALRGAPLLLDCGDEATDSLLSGYVRVVTGYRESMVYRVGK